MPPSYLFGATFLALSASAVGCAAPAKPAVSVATTTTSAPVPRETSVIAREPAHELIALVHTEDEDTDDTPRGTLVIARDVIDACPAVRDAKAPQGREAMQWLTVLRSITDCVTRGQLGAIVLHGPSRPQLIVRAVFAGLGLPEERVELTQVEGQRSCDDDCTPRDLRVEIGVAASSALATSL